MAWRLGRRWAGVALELDADAGRIVLPWRERQDRSPILALPLALGTTVLACGLLEIGRFRDYLVAAGIAAGLAVLAVWLGRWLLARFQLMPLVFDETGIGGHTPWGPRAVRWDDVEAIVHLHRLTLQFGRPMTFRIKVFRAVEPPLLFSVPPLSRDEQADFLDTLEAVAAERGVRLVYDHTEEGQAWLRQY